MMKVSEIRQEFLSFFQKKNHTVLPSSSLIPQADPTLLFTNAGMVQFKRYFLGEEPDYINVATCQRCLRAGGKHNDLENVGKTARHLTFFEMLGNFSFGGYFKREAIKMAWELVTEIFKLPKERIIATVFEEDDEAEKIWLEETDVKEVIRLGKSSNFWTMGDEGPAGPCSEIIYDRGEGVSDKDHKCNGPTCDCDRFLEIWNLVFMQFNLIKDGRIEPLKRKNIDTGMGLERIAMILQNKSSVFDTDVFEPLKNELSIHAPEVMKDEFTLRVVLDAARAASFAIADGIMPSNESRGYVIRRIIRRALRHSIKYTDSPFLHMVSSAVVKSMNDFWTHLKGKEKIVSETVKMEEEKFFENLARALPLLEREIEDTIKAQEKELDVDSAFMLWETYGLPLDIIKEVAGERGLSLNEEKLSQKIEEWKQKSKRTDKEDEELITKRIYSIIPSQSTEFLGYYTTYSEGLITHILDKDLNTKKIATEGDEVFIATDKTPFYPEGGGQVGDSGIIRTESGIAKIYDTKKMKGDIILHKAKVIQGKLVENSKAFLEVDRLKREQSAKHHTTTHLLHSALRNLFGTHIRQMGSLVEPKRLRFDFSHPVPLSESDIDQIENTVNEWIMLNFDVEHEYVKFEEAIRRGALAFFGDKYGKIVRVVKIGEVSLELCGGTHLKQTGQAGILKVIKESSVASGVRRIEAVAGFELIKYIREKENYIKELANILKVSPSDVLKKIKSITEEKEKLESEVDSLRKRLAETISNPQIKEINGKRIIFDYLRGLGKKEASYLVDKLREKLQNSAVLVVTESDGKLFIVGGTNIPQINIGDVVKRISNFLGGTGGGKQSFAEGSGKVAKPKNEIFEKFEEIVKEQLGEDKRIN